MENLTGVTLLCVAGFAVNASAQDMQVEPAPAYGPTSQLAYDRSNIMGEGNLTAGIWYSQAEQVSLSLGIEQSKLFGTDENMRLSFEASAFTQNLQLTLVDPDFYEGAYSRQLAFSLYNATPNKSQNGDYSFSGGEASISFGRALSNGVSFSFGAGVNESRIQDSATLPTFISDYIALEGENTTTVFTFANLLLDRTDGGARPMRGYQIGVGTELGTVEGTVYTKNEIAAHHYTPFGDSVRLHVRGNIAAGSVLGDGPYPIFENYFAGGPGSVRGYAQNSLGPTSSIPESSKLAYTGATVRVTGGAELSTKLLDAEDVYGLAYFDFGNVFADDVDTSDLRTSVGLGVTWDSPIGPISVYYSYPLNDQATDNVEQLQFTLGAQF
ncbi:MAG: BamA/TamA family outer membrane protein [Celeribacter marinus]